MKEFLLGCLKLNSEQPHDQIEKLLNAAILMTENAPEVTSLVVKTNKNSVFIEIKREQKYLITGDWLTADDCSLIFGIEPACFGIDPIGKFREKYEEMGIPVPFIQPTIPYAGEWYVGKTEAIKTFRKINKTICMNTLSKVKIEPADDSLIISFEIK